MHYFIKGMRKVKSPQWNFQYALCWIQHADYQRYMYAWNRMDQGPSEKTFRNKL